MTMPAEPEWYKDAIIYQTHVRAFCDSNADGIGDFRGLAEKLDYISELGVTAVWLLPFFPSPLRDGGYDTSDYLGIHEEYGNLRDFKSFLKKAHGLGIRVISEMVMNHTSDQHEWFQKSRHAAPDSKWRNYYVWSDTPDLYKDARIIFQDFEASNWTWDPVAHAYYWHRFYSHQPDLNFENPEVQQAMFDAVDFWLDLGVDGLRLDAVPYLFEADGTNCENLPETHQFLRDLRSHVDSKFPDRMLLAEANQWPEDAAEYFGDGDECHMNFHFPLMPRLYMAVEREDRFPIVDILEQTPPLPPGCQWAIFLRNHDELTLEMVTDEERDSMYRAYAEDPRARVNLGIRRRLAPLMKNDRRKIELLNGLLLSLPGTPVIYYGDELGMGDNIYLGDRDALRSPMQWNPDRNAGFSHANAQKLYLPVIIDAEYHYSATNVEVQHNSPHSLLWWMRRIIHLRRQHASFGRGSLQFLNPENPKVLAYLREDENETILVVANLSRFPQFAELDLSKFRGRQPVELFGSTEFPPIGELPYFLTLSGYEFYWFRLQWSDTEVAPTEAAPFCEWTVTKAWDDLFESPGKRQLEKALPKWLPQRRWFGGKARKIQQTKIQDVLSIGNSRSEPMRLLIVQVDYRDGAHDHYLLPLVLAEEARGLNIRGDHPAAVLGSVERSSHPGDVRWVCEAVYEADFWQPFMQTVQQRKSIAGKAGATNVELSKTLAPQLKALPGGILPSVHGGQQSNTSAVFGETAIMKLFRRLSPGVNPDLEIGLQLTNSAARGPVPGLMGAISWEPAKGQSYTLAVVHEFVPNKGDAWVATMDELGRYFVRVTSREIDGGPARPRVPDRPLLELATVAVPETSADLIGPYLEYAELLGQRTAEMHLALAQDTDNKAFAPESFTKLYQRSLYQSMRSNARKVLNLLRRQIDNLSAEARALAESIASHEEKLMERYAGLTEHKFSALRTRCHGDYHLGQVLDTGRDLLIIDFEGEPDRPIGERVSKMSPVKDVAGMVRSFHYASYAARFGQAPGADIGPEAQEDAAPWMDEWYRWTSARFLASYLEVATTANFLPEDEKDLKTLFNAYTLDKAFYELGYELNNRPGWVRIPLEGIAQALAAGA